MRKNESVPVLNRKPNLYDFNSPTSNGSGIVNYAEEA
jgi:hypothetical protein